jgi:hypothetical protein
MDRGMAAERILNKKGSWFENFLAASVPRMFSGSLRIKSGRETHAPSHRTWETPLGWAPIHSSAMGLAEGEGSPRSSGMKVLDPQAYSWTGFLRSAILFKVASLAP